MTSGLAEEIIAASDQVAAGDHLVRSLEVPAVRARIAVVGDEQRKAHEELYGIPAGVLPGEEADEEEDMTEPMQLVADNGDTSADGGDILNADEVVAGGDLIGGGDDLLG